MSDPRDFIPPASVIAESPKKELYNWVAGSWLENLEILIFPVSNQFPAGCGYLSLSLSLSLLAAHAGGGGGGGGASLPDILTPAPAQSGQNSALWIFLWHFCILKNNIFLAARGFCKIQKISEILNHRTAISRRSYSIIYWPPKNFHSAVSGCREKVEWGVWLMLTETPSSPPSPSPSSPHPHSSAVSHSLTRHTVLKLSSSQPDPLSACWMFAQEANKHLSIGHLNVVFVLVPCLVSALSIIIVILILNLTIHKYVNRPSLFSIMTTTQIKNISNISNRIFWWLL